VNLRTFIADSAPDAVAQIRAELGPSAVVVNVRQVPSQGLARLWQKPRIEVVAALPDPDPLPSPALPAPSDAIEQIRLELSEIRQKVGQLHPVSDVGVPGADPSPGWTGSNPSAWEPEPRPSSSSWQISNVLEQSGLSPLATGRILDELRARHGDEPSATLRQEIEWAREVMIQLWSAHQNHPRSGSKMHVFVGPPGVGKTTCLCKWLARSVLVEGQSAQVWRLDGCAANTADSLSLYGEILGVPVDRFVPNQFPSDGVMQFVDLPGTNPSDPSGMEHLRQQIETLPSPQIHLVLNAAYESATLLTQVRAFASLPVTDLILSHLDEEPRWGKAWNLVLGTNYSLRLLSAGQNVPGDLLDASAQTILTRQFARK